MNQWPAFRERVGGLDALALTAAVWFLAKFVRYLFPPLFDTLEAGYGVSNATLGAAYGAMMLAYAGMQFPSGALGDRVGPARVLVWSGVFAAAGALWIAATDSLLALVAGMIVLGLGTGAHKTVAVRLLSTVYPARTGRVLGVYDTAGAFGGVAAPVAVVSAAAWDVGWRTAFLVAGLAGLLGVAAFRLRVPRAAGVATGSSAGGAGRESGADSGTGAGGDGPSSTSAGAALREYASALAAPRLAAFVAVTVLFSLAYNAAVAFFPKFLVDAGGLDPALAGAAYSGLFLASLVQPVTGDASDRLGRLPVTAGTLLLATASLGVALVTTTPALLVAAVVGFGLGSHGFRPIRGAYLVETLPGGAAGGGLGAVRTALMGAGAVSPPVVGYVADAAGFRVAFALLLVALGLGAAVATALALTGE